jgi:hypothetical protein
MLAHLRAAQANVANATAQFHGIDELGHRVNRELVQVPRIPGRTQLKALNVCAFDDFDSARH